MTSFVIFGFFLSCNNNDIENNYNSNSKNIEGEKSKNEIMKDKNILMEKVHLILLKLVIYIFLSPFQFFNKILDIHKN